MKASSPPTRVGVVGGGQLAMMMGEAAAGLELELCVLASSPEDSAGATIGDVVIGSPGDASALERLAQRCEVITFDHELVDLDILAALEANGHVLRPSSLALRFAVDKAYQREVFLAHHLPVPRFLVVSTPRDPRLPAFLDQVDARVVVKAARGGYDGRGVAFAANRADAVSLIEEFSGRGEVVVEEHVALRGEAAQIVARGVEGETAIYPLVTTVQQEGMCAEVRYPSEFGDVEGAAADLSARIAGLVQGVGVMAVEYFVTEEGLVINEVALRPHNSGHWTIEGVTTSQFAQHLLAVAGRPLTRVEPLTTNAVMVNVVGAPEPGSLEKARAIPDVFVHDYHKSWRPGRKLGHVTALGAEPDAVRVRAWQSARAYGTKTQEA
jgi:5-(carboxyamino)imidazole ribonucleotide synthase